MRFQTIFWTPEVRLCDCPGLVCPSTAGMELQVLGGIIPIQNTEIVSQYVFKRVPLEKILGLPPAPVVEDPRRGRRPVGWTTDDILSKHALSHSFITAKAGRPDVSRAGAAILRMLHSSSIAWAFRPPPPPEGSRDGGEWDWPEHEGIWIVSGLGEHNKGELVDGGIEDVDEASDRSEAENSDGTLNDEHEEEKELSQASTDEEEEDEEVAGVGGAFGVLAIDNDEADSSESE
jgi:hypothetical protein